MKKLLSLFLITFVLISCNKNVDSLLKEKITQKIKPTFKNPDSFEFVSLEYKTENVKTRKPKITKEKIESLIGNEFGVELMERMKKEKLFLDKQTDENVVAVYLVKFIAKGTNSFGAIIQNEYNVEVLNDEEFSILSLKN
jgi:hypothetical protein